jgi:DNA topoisomerase-1
MGTFLVIVESPAKAKTIERYLGDGWVVKASVGHIRDLLKKEKGNPVPGVDLANDFQPTYEVSPDSKKVVAELKRLAKKSDEVWFATDLDREGEAIAWHLAEELNVDPAKAKRVTFNAITKTAIAEAFKNPRPIDMDRVNAQQTRRILDRIVGYQISPLLWKRVAAGISAGRVQSVATRLVVEREREIRAHIPDESWHVVARFTSNPDDMSSLASDWSDACKGVGDEGMTRKDQFAWMAQRGALGSTLMEVDGVRVDLQVGAEGWSNTGKQEKQHRVSLLNMATCVGLSNARLDEEEDPDGKGPAARRLSLHGDVDPAARYTVASITQKQSKSRGHAPFITSSLQAAAANTLGYTAKRTMGAAQKLYQGIEIRGEGQTALITYMRTDSTHVSPEAIKAARAYIDTTHGDAYLPSKPNVYASANADAQEAHEAIRPTDAFRHPDDLPASVDNDLRKLYRLIWNRFISSQMTPAVWDRTEIMLRRTDTDSGAAFRSTGRILKFDGFYRVAGVPSTDSEQILPNLAEGQILAPFSIEPEQKFSPPPSRYTEASLVKNLEKEGIGRPSTYASIIDTIQRRMYVEKMDRNFRATFLGEKVTDRLIEAFPKLMDLGYTRYMEKELDRIAKGELNWVAELHAFYVDFAEALEHAEENMTHAKAELEPADWKCPECGARTAYRLGRRGRFLTCSAFPDCTFGCGVDRDGKPQLVQGIDMKDPNSGAPMVLRNGRFGPFIATGEYTKGDFVLNVDKKTGGLKFPSVPPLLTELECNKCESKLNLRTGKRGPWLGCSRFPKCRGRGKWSEVDDEQRTALEKELAAHEAANPRPRVYRLDGTTEVVEGELLTGLLLPGEADVLEVHDDAIADRKAAN